MKECEVLLKFKVSEDKMRYIYNAREELAKAGIDFDSGGCVSNVDGRKIGNLDWEFDWSLKGPIKVYFKRFKLSSGDGG